MTEDQLILIECLVDKEIWEKWKQKSQELGITISYYIAEFL